MSVKVLVLRVAGTNCEIETAAAFESAGAESETLHFNQLRSSPERVQDYNIIAIPGGFSYGDDIGSGVVFAQQLRSVLRKEVERFLDNGGLMLGICNGFQVLVKSGLITAESGHFEDIPSATLTWNASARYEDRWVRLSAKGGQSPWIAKDCEIECPVRHAEGRFVTKDEATMKRLEANGQILFRYLDKDGNATEAYPFNPNGSPLGVAGACSKSGQVMGLMPHPECHTAYWHHPEWTRNKRDHAEGEGMVLFRDGVNSLLARQA